MPPTRSSKPQGRPSAAKRSGSSGSGRRSASSRTDANFDAPRDSKSDVKPRSNDRTPAKRKKQGEQPFAVNEREQREGVRLQKFMASAGVSSRRKAEELIESGAVQVNGRVVKELGARVFPGRDRVTVRGEPIAAESKVYYVLNKPDQVVSSAAGSVDERGRPTVLSLMHGIPQRLYPVGRLDYHSRGVMLLTNDGVLAAALTHPRHGVVKTYHVKFQGKLSPEQEQALRDGIELDDGDVTRPLVELFAFRETASNVWYQIGLTEGLNRQLRRMGEAIDRPVLKLIRVAIGDITADGLADGEFRALSTTEVGQLLASVQPDPARASAPAGTATPAKSGARRGAGGAQPPSRAKISRTRASTSSSGSRASDSKRGESDARPRASSPRPSTSNSGAKPRAGDSKPPENRRTATPKRDARPSEDKRGAPPKRDARPAPGKSSSSGKTSGAKPSARAAKPSARPTANKRTRNK